MTLALYLFNIMLLISMIHLLDAIISLKEKQGGDK